LGTLVVLKKFPQKFSPFRKKIKNLSKLSVKLHGWWWMNFISYDENNENE
jgi:hypothetical protein